MLNAARLVVLTSFVPYQGALNTRIGCVDAMSGHADCHRRYLRDKPFQRRRLHEAAVWPKGGSRGAGICKCIGGVGHEELSGLGVEWNSVECVVHFALSYIRTFGVVPPCEATRRRAKVLHDFCVEGFPAPFRASPKRGSSCGYWVSAPLLR